MTPYQKIDQICERLEGYKLHNPATAKLSYSGGRDSHLLLHIIRNVMKYDNTVYPAIYANTHNEHNEIRHRILEQDITIVDSGRKVFEIFKTEGLPLWGKQFSKAWNDIHVRGWNIKFTNEKIDEDYRKRIEWVNANRLLLSDGCCKLLKENILKKSGVNIVGIRKSEGGRRSRGRSKNYDFCVRNSKVLFKPIFDVTDCEFCEIEKVLGLHKTQLDIYNFTTRTGCVMCGFGTKRGIQEKLTYMRLYEPAKAKFYIKYFNDYLKYRKII